MMGLRYRADMQTVAYMLVSTVIPIAHWRHDAFNAGLLVAAIVMAFAISAMHHNHQHVPIWTSPTFNCITDVWFTLFQGHPGFVFEPVHVENHHRYHNGAADLTRTNRHDDTNNLMGLLFHPYEFVSDAMPCIIERVHRVFRQDRDAFALIALQYFALIAVDGVLLWTDALKTFYCVLVPQAAALFFLLISNYLQHAHAEGESEFNHSRNFLGLINPLCFNVGYHTAHHHVPERHWSELPAVHRELAPRIARQLIERSFGWYCLRVFILSLFVGRFRSTSMRQSVQDSVSRSST